MGRANPPPRLNRGERRADQCRGVSSILRSTSVRQRLRLVCAANVTKPAALSATTSGTPERKTPVPADQARVTMPSSRQVRDLSGGRDHQ